MNGLRLIRTICNFSQTALADELGVSRQAINMWENGRRNIPEDRKQQLCDFFGINEAAWLDELDDEMVKTISDHPLYRAKEEFEDAKSVHYFFTPDKCRYGDFGGKGFYADEIISVDEKCILKREELKTLIRRIQDYTCKDVEKENSYDAAGRIQRTIDPINALIDALEVGDQRWSLLKMPHYYTVLAVLDALNLVFNNISESELAPHCSNPLAMDDLSYRERYDYTPLAIKLSKEISEHWAHIEELFEEFKHKKKEE